MSSSGSGAGGACLGRDEEDSGFGFTADFDGGMKKLCEGFETGDEARTGARKITVGFESVDAVIADRGNGVPLLRKRHRSIFIAGLFGAIAARGNQKDFRSGLDDIFERDAE